MNLQLENFFDELKLLQKKYGNPQLNCIFGAGLIRNPEILLLFMNPTARNISSQSNWKGMCAPWLGTKNTWRLLFKSGLISKELYEKTQSLKTSEWTNEFCIEVYSSLAKHKVYLTNLAKCTQDDARPLSNKVFKEYLDIAFREISEVNPKKIITFGNQVSSILLSKNISVSKYESSFEELKIQNKIFKVYPTYYPVGQGMRNMNKAIERIKWITLQ